MKFREIPIAHPSGQRNANAYPDSDESPKNLQSCKYLWLSVGKRQTRTEKRKPFGKIEQNYQARFEPIIRNIEIALTLILIIKTRKLQQK